MRRWRYAWLVSGYLLLGAGGVAAQVGPPGLTVTVTATQATYLFNDPTDPDPVTLEVTVTNTESVAIVTAASFLTIPVEEQLTFVDPAGNPITVTNPGGSPEGVAPERVVVEEAGEKVFAEVVPVVSLVFGEEVGALTRTIVVPDLYSLPVAGAYTVVVSIPMVRYDPAAVFQTSSGQDVVPVGSTVFNGQLVSNTEAFALVADADNDTYCFPEQDTRLCSQAAPDCDDSNASVNPGATEILNNGLDDDCNPATPDVLPPVTAAPGTIVVTAQLHTVGPGQHPGAAKAPLVAFPVRVFDRSPGSCAKQIGVSWQHHRTIWFVCGDEGQKITDNDGEATLPVPPSEYLVLGEFVPASGEPLYVAKNVGLVEEGEFVATKLNVIVKANGTTVPAKSTKKTGSELWIIEPEYIEWSGTEELYPFIFDSVGEWNVTTSVTPPEGFVADVSVLTEEVNSELEAVQFTITDIGSHWVETGVTHTLTHKGKKQKVKSKVGVKLSKGLAQAKGLTRFGKALPPGLSQ